MTFITRFLAEPSDILALRLKCQKCKASLSIPFDETQQIPERCVNPSSKKRDWFFENSLEEARSIHSSRPCTRCGKARGTDGIRSRLSLSNLPSRHASASANDKQQPWRLLPA